MGMKSFGLRHALLMSAAAFGVSMGTTAVQPVYAQEATRSYDIPAQDLDDALREFGRQTGRDVLFTPQAVAGKRSSAIQGQMTERQALDALLNGTGLRFQQTASNGYAVQDPSSPTQLGAADQSASRGGPTGEGATSEILVIGQRPTLNADIRRSEDGAQPYVVLDREDIERSGAQNLNDFLGRALSSATSPTAVSGQGPGNSTSSGSAISLRGLNPNQTLILVDGRRIAETAFNGFTRQADIEAIPLAAIERIEVLPATSSGIYGGSAVGGVVNIILRRDYSGAEARITYGNTFDSDVMRRRGDFTAGYSLNDGGTNVMFSASYSDGNELLAGDRDYTERARALQFSNNPNALINSFFPPLGATTNIRSANGAMLTLKPAFGGGSVGSNITYVPYGYAGPSSDNGTGLIANGGAFNFDLANTAQASGLRQNLVSTPTLQSANLTIRHEFFPWLSAFADLSASENNGSFINSGANTSFTLQPSAPGNPFNQPIRVTTPGLGADTMFEFSIENVRAASGIVFDMPFDWRGAADFSWNRTTYSNQSPATLGFSATTDVTSGALNIFRDTSQFAVDFGAYLNAPSSIPNAESIFQDAALRLSGPLPFRLPGGVPTASVLLEARTTEIEDSYTILNGSPSSLFPRRSQDVQSAYAELLLPFIGATNNIPGVQLLELQIAGRFDRYQTDGANGNIPIDANYNPLLPIERSSNEIESTDPTIGMRYVPIEGLMLRASYGTGFLPPSVNQIVTTETPIDAGLASAIGFTDPLRGDEIIGGVSGFDLLSDGRPDLEPEQSESLSLGVVLTPTFAPGLRFSIDWVQIEKEDAIASLGLDQATINQLVTFAPDLLVRDTDPSTFGSFGVGPIRTIDARLINATTQRVEAIDFAFEYQITSESFGNLTASARATHMIENLVQANPASPVVDRAGTLTSTAAFSGGLDWQGSVTFTWERDNWTAAWTTRYFDSYYVNEFHTVDPNLGSATVPSQTYHDILVSYRFGGIAALRDTELQLGINNLFDTAAPLNPSGLAFGTPYSRLADARGAEYFVSLRRSF